MIFMQRLTPLFLFAMATLASDIQVSPQEEQAVRKLIANYSEAVNSRDASRIAALFAPDGDYQSPQGAISNGRSVIQSDQAKAYGTVMRSAKASFEIKRIRFLAPDVSIIDTVFERYGVLDPEGRPVAGRRRALATFILKKENGRWEIASYRNVVPVAFAPGGPTIFDEPGMKPSQAIDRKR